MSPAERAAHPNGLALLLVTALAFGVARTVLFLTVETGDPLTIQWSLGVAQIDVLRRYLTLLVAPHGQTIFHAVAPFEGLDDLRLWWALIVAAGLLAWTALVARRVPIATWGMAWFLLALVPPAALVFFNRGEPMAEHRAYLAGCGAFVAVGALALRVALRVAERLSRRGWPIRLAGGAHRFWSRCPWLVGRLHATMAGAAAWRCGRRPPATRRATGCLNWRSGRPSTTLGSI